MQGKNISGYTLQRLLGVGGMAEVWLAENKIGKRAAVKLLLPKFCDEVNIVERFENEAKVMVQLEHPYIRQVYDYDQSEGRPCIIMEYLEGNDLKAMMKEGRHFSDQELVRWWNQMVQALNYTHSLGIVHRDIKPSNIFIDRYGNVRLMDFGIAKNNDGGTGTLTGSTLGTRIYMSPEQVKDPKRVDYRSDLYSLAVTFVHLLTGKAPYDSTTSSDFEIQMNIVMKPLDLSEVREPWKGFLEPYLEKDSNRRPSLRDYVQNKIIQTKEEETVVSVAGIVSKEEETIVGDGSYHPLETKINNHDDLAFTVNGVSFVMKKVEGGSFRMGAYYNHIDSKDYPDYDYSADNDECPVHEVTLNSYYLGETVVTEALWCAVNDLVCIRPNYPKSYLSWIDCMAFVRKLNSLTGKTFRLPTEAEWEYAARGGNKSKGYKYAGSDDFGNVAWTAENSNHKFHPVGMKEANELGLYDMSGNIGEWCEDRYGEYTMDSQINPHGPSTGNYRVYRGGSMAYVARRCRVSNREYANSDSRSDYYGFRLALSE